MLSGLKSALATKKPSAAPAAGGKKWKTRGQLAEEQQQPAASSDSGPQPFEGIKKRRVDGMALYEDAGQQKAPLLCPAPAHSPIRSCPCLGSSGAGATRGTRCDGDG